MNKLIVCSPLLVAGVTQSVTANFALAKSAVNAVTSTIAAIRPAIKPLETTRNPESEVVQKPPTDLKGMNEICDLLQSMEGLSTSFQESILPKPDLKKIKNESANWTSVLDMFLTDLAKVTQSNAQNRMKAIQLGNHAKDIVKKMNVLLDSMNAGNLGEEIKNESQKFTENTTSLKCLLQEKLKMNPIITPNPNQKAAIEAASSEGDTCIINGLLSKSRIQIGTAKERLQNCEKRYDEHEKDLEKNKRAITRDDGTFDKDGSAKSRFGRSKKEIKRRCVIGFILF